MKMELSRDLTIKESEALEMHTSGAGNSDDEIMYEDMIIEANKRK
jgi:hypothetical protein